VDPNDGGPIRDSNQIFYKVLGPSSGAGIDLVAWIPPAQQQFEVTNAIAINPQGTLAFVGGTGGEVFTYNISPTSPGFHQPAGAIGPANNEIRDLAVTADGKSLFICDGTDVAIMDVDPTSFTFGKNRPDVVEGDYPFVVPNVIACSPDNQYVLIFEDELKTVILVNATGLSDNNAPFNDDGIGVPASVVDIAFHPTGLHAYLALDSPPVILVVEMDDDQENFFSIIDTEPANIEVGEALTSLAISPDGETLLARNLGFIQPWPRRIIEYNVPDPITAPGDTITRTVSNSTGPAQIPAYNEGVYIKPNADRGVFTQLGDGHTYWDLSGSPGSGAGGIGASETFGANEGAFTPDGSRFYVASTIGSRLSVYDFNIAQNLVKVSGDNQMGVVDELLAAPLRVLAQDSNGDPVPDIVINFNVDNGGGVLLKDGLFRDEINVVTDADGLAEVDWKMSDTEGTYAVVATSNAILHEFPALLVVFLGTGVTDPETLPLTLAQVVPLDNSNGVSVTTALQATFSRGVDPTTVDNTTYFVHPQGDPTPVEAVYGFTDSNGKVSITPTAALDYSTTYEVEATAGLLDDNGGPLTNPGTTTFTTGPPPPLAITAVNPPSSAPLATLTITGQSFDAATPANNTVNFSGGGIAVATASGVNFVTVQVPLGAQSGVVSVTVNSATSNSLPFSVLAPIPSVEDDVVGTAFTGSSGKTMAVSPDGAVAWSVVPDNDHVVTILIDDIQTLPAVGVGDEPVSIAINPQGTGIYTTNYSSSSVSVINADQSDPDFNTIEETIIVGANPVDLAFSPTGDRLYVVNIGSNDLAIVDGDEASSTYNAVIGRAIGGSNPTAVAVSPDGTIYLGTDTGYDVLEPVSYGVIGNGFTGSSAKTMAVSPDNTLLYILDTSGDVLIIDVDPLSSSHDQVIGTGTPGSRIRSMSTSPDGALYLIPEDSDEVIVISVETEGNVSVLEDYAELPPRRVIIIPLGTFPTGQNPAHVAFDPRGNGRWLVSVPGDMAIEIRGIDVRVPVEADIKVTPRTLNLSSRGRWVSGRIQLPAAFSPFQINQSTVMLQEVIPIVPDKSEIKDGDGDGIEELHVKFDRAAFQMVLPEGDSVEVNITGMMTDGRQFAGLDTIRTHRPKVTHPSAGQIVALDVDFVVRWDSPTGVNVDAVDVHWSADDGETWGEIEVGVPDQGYAIWHTPQIFTEQARIMVTLYKNGNPVGIGMSQETFSLAMPVAVHLSSFKIGIEEGAAVMRWETSSEFGVNGFRMHRATSENGTYEPLHDDPLPAENSVQGGSYEYRDESIRVNQTYYYKLEEIVSTGVGQAFGPYEVTFRAVFELQQNHPNPFNPTTTIRYTIPQNVPVRLQIFDVKGRLVRTLVDENQQAAFYKMEWNGRNNRGQQVSSGVYFYRLRAGSFTETRKMMLLK